MIPIIDNWVLLVDANNYTLAKYYGEKKMKHGKMEPVYIGRKYYTSLTKAFEGLREQIQREVLSGDYLSLTDALTRVIESNERLTAEIARVREILEGRHEQN